MWKLFPNFQFISRLCNEWGKHSTSESCHLFILLSLKRPSCLWMTRPITRLLAPPTICPSYIQRSFQFTWFLTPDNLLDQSPSFPPPQVTITSDLSYFNTQTCYLPYCHSLSLFNTSVCASAYAFVLMIPCGCLLGFLLFILSDNIQPTFSLQLHLSQSLPSCQATYILAHDRCHRCSPLSHTLKSWWHQLWRSFS